MSKKSVVCLFVFVMIAFLLSGCGCFMQAQRGETAPPPAPAAVAPSPEPAREVPVAAGPAKEVPVAGLQDINFDFDKYNIRPGDADILKQDANNWFKANPGKKVWIEGNCDERGTVEYNLVLGQKRADSAKNYLVGLGIDGKLMETVSYGKERPICPDHNEDCWAKNRRDHFKPMQ